MQLEISFHIDLDWLLWMRDIQDEINNPLQSFKRILSQKYNVIYMDDDDLCDCDVIIGPSPSGVLPDEEEIKETIDDFFMKKCHSEQYEYKDQILHVLTIETRPDPEPETDPEPEEEDESPEDLPFTYAEIERALADESPFVELRAKDADELPFFTDSDKAPAESDTAPAENGLPPVEITGPATVRYKYLVAAKELKDFVEECIAIAPGICEHNAQDAFTAQCYLFSINDGYGFSTYVQLLFDLFAELRLLGSSARKSGTITEITLPYPKMEQNGQNEPFGEILLKQLGEKEPPVMICVDISEWMSSLKDIRFRKLLQQAAEKRGSDQILIFRVPFIEKNVLRNIQDVLEDVLTIKPISIPPFSTSDLNAIAFNSLRRKNFTIEKDAWEPFEEKMLEEKNDGRFYGINTVNKVVKQIIYSKHVNDARDKISDWSIRATDVESILSQRKSRQPEDFDNMIGMEKIKERVLEIVAQIKASLRSETLERPCIHMRFLGPPGTGKTTAARIIGRMLKESGVLRNGLFLECSARELCGRYIGETAPKTSAMCRDAYGSVLFIDEAYSLYRGDDDTRDFGREAIDTLVAEMENHRSDFLVIMAGYTKEMEDMMTANPGLRDRIPYQIEFPAFSREQLAEIYLNMAKKEFLLNEGVEQAVREYFDGLPDEIVKAKDFSNARFVRNLYERTWGKASRRAETGKNSYGTLNTLTEEDFRQACAEPEFNGRNQSGKKPIGF